MRVVTIPAVEVTIGMKLRSFTAPDFYYTVETIKEFESGGREFGLRFSKDMKFRTSFFAADENAKLLLRDNELDPVITVVHIECVYCHAQFPCSKIEINQNIQVECPDCERTMLAQDCK